MDTHFAVLPLGRSDMFRVSHLPNETSGLPHFLRLPHPRTGIPSLFLAHEPNPNASDTDGKCVSKILEVQAVEPPNARSWFIGDEVVSDGKLLVMTPVDPLFLLIPMLRGINQPGGSVGNFRPAEDIFEDAARYIAEASKTVVTQDAPISVEVEDVMRFAALDCTKKAMKRLCDVKEVTPEITVFRYSAEKLMQELRKKVMALSAPRTMELSRCLVRSLAKDALMEDRHEDLYELGRIKLACELLGQYLVQDIQGTLVASYDFARLDIHVKEQSSPVPETSTTIKKPKAGPETTSEGTKKRKKDSKASQGVEKLKKANINGMTKLSTFFTKKGE
ncbi:ribonuclease H2, subunit B [Chiua virens]|nr:ribonuclease H2, subunit B [Chiua virens]